MSSRPIQPAIRNFPNGCGPFSQRITHISKGCPHKDDDEDFSTKNLNFVSYDEMGYPSNATISSGVVVRSYSTQPRVSAIRDFPPLCGFNVHKKEENHDNEPGSVVKENVKNHGEENFRYKSLRKKVVFSSSRIVSHGDEVPSKFDYVYKSSNVPVLGHGRFDVGGSSNQNKGKSSKEVPHYVGNKFSKKEGKGCVQRKMQEFPNVNVVAPFDRNGRNVKARIRVRATLRLFHAVCRRLMKEENKMSRGGGRADVRAAKFLYDNGKYINEGKQIIGPVPGVEVGDEFQYWKELNIVGLHNQLLAGIGFSKHNGRVLATSVVSSSGHYDDEMDSTDVLVYTGQGGNVIKNKNTDKPEDQKLERGNLALKNSIEAKNPVRVIMKSESKDGSCKIYAYYGLYEVVRYWQERWSHGMLVFKFEMRRIPGQLDVPWKELKKSEKSKMRKGLFVGDISYGKELIPVCAINTVDDEKPPKFEYLSSMTYPNWYRPIPPVGCDCTSGCTDSEKCACAVKNGGKIPFNHNKAIVEAKPKSIVYECGPHCRCPPTCHNRVSQHGVKFQFEIFKTKTKGWGVRSLNTIPSGSFICEYTGKLLEDAEAEKNIGKDEYLFDIGNNYVDSSLCEELLKIMPDAGDSSSSQVFEDGGFTINAANYGNVGRFINHSCSPNLFTQNVLYDHDDKKIPHIMLFADMNIPRMQELAYHYNYKIDQVFDSDGNIKKKNCFCGALECTGRMY
ncbi:putative histone-lysine N-methyltransferase chromatin remodeling SET family [Lupinus albus]|uniref:Putative histone-lysine N-methyltransferase chromatin remodeling SET family n=1 Tax=Lupinus albus TaxID=3870 RepID=A0A6A4RAE5_LUPAL|nr:putative histone-lysine N-methyltransferase chromatin remodeling SET family [Lupinus albus]